MPLKQSVRHEVRWMVRRDTPTVLQIEAESNDEYSCWDEEELIRNLRSRNNIGMVATVDGQVAGYMVYSLHKHYLHLLKMAVDEPHRYQGLGRMMIAKLQSKLSADRRNSLIYEASERNLPGHLFLKRVGFKAVGVFAGQAPGGEDVYQFILEYQPAQGELEYQSEVLFYE